MSLGDQAAGYLIGVQLVERLREPLGDALEALLAAGADRADAIDHLAQGLRQGAERLEQEAEAIRRGVSDGS